MEGGGENKMCKGQRKEERGTQNCFAYISATKYHSKAVLYSKQMARYPLSPHINTITVAYLQAE